MNQNCSNVKNTAVIVKTSVNKTMVKEAVTSPTAGPPPPPPPPGVEPTSSTELLGSLTTQQQQRTSARVIKKLRLESDVEKKPISDISECETTIKPDEKDLLKFPTVKQRMPKALWSANEKSLFFEALNEYGKDFDAITSYICAKIKKKGVPDANLKTKTQVSHFYYRTWHKLSKHVHFGENVKKVAQELYALINYGELRKKLVSVNEKTCARLGEMVLCGSIVVRARGKNVRVRTPICRALMKLNQITERACGSRVCARAQVLLRARDSAAWARVQAAAHNPRSAVALPLRVRLDRLIAAFHKRWGNLRFEKYELLENGNDQKYLEESHNKEMDDNCHEPKSLLEDKDDERVDLEEHLHLEMDRMISQEQKLSKRPVLHVGPRPDASIHLPVVSPGEQMSSQKISLQSYLERMCAQRPDDPANVKIRTAKRQRKDSTSEKDKDGEQKKIKIEEGDPKLMILDETAIDGIELMASYKTNQDDDEKPSTEDEKVMKIEDTLEEDIERDKDIIKDVCERDKDMLEKEKDSFSEMEDDVLISDVLNKSDTDNESDQGKSDKCDKDTKFKNLKVKFSIRSKKRSGTEYVLGGENNEESKIEMETKPDIDVETAIKQIRRGWSMYDAGDLTIGDLYLMFGSRSRIELDYWWAPPTPPLPQPCTAVRSQKYSETDKSNVVNEKNEKVDKVVESFCEESDKDRASQNDTDILSPKNNYSQDSNDGLSGDEKKSEQVASPEHKSSCSSTLKLASKLVNRPVSPSTPNGFSLLGDRLKRLLALVGNTHISPSVASSTIARCNCGHVCPQQKKQHQKQVATTNSTASATPTTVFRHPTPIAPKPNTACATDLNLSDVPRSRRGRPRSDRRVVVQRLLPLLPKQPHHDNLIPVKIVPNLTPPPAKILPKPLPTSAGDLSHFYMLSECNGQYYFHDGERRVPITSLTDDDKESQTNGAAIKTEVICKDQTQITQDIKVEHDSKSGETTLADGDSGSGVRKTEASDIANFVASESMSLSPSRLLRDTENWLEGSAQDYSLSSLLGHLERAQPDIAESHLQSLMAESSVDYVAKFADLAAEVTEEVNALTSPHTT